MPATEKSFFAPGEAGLFSFFGNEPTSYEALLHRRKIAEALAAQKKGFPKNVGEGLTYLGESIGEAGLNWRLRQAEQAQDSREAGFESGAPRGGSTYVPGGAAYSPNNSPPGGPARSAPAAAPAPRAAITPDPAVAETVAAAEGDPAQPQQLAYAPAAPRDPPVDVELPEVNVDTAAPRPFFGGDPMNAPMARGVPSSMLSGQNVYKPPLTGGVATSQPAQHLVGQGRQAVGVPDQAVMEDGLRRLGAQRLAETGGNALFDPNPAVPAPAEKVYAENELSPLDAAAPDVVANVPLPRGRPEAPAVVADGGFNALDQAAVNRANPMVRGVNPKLIEAVNAGALALPEGHTVRISSGHRPGDSGYHGRHSAIDVKIVRPDGTEIPSRGEDKTGLYTQLARGAYTHALKNEQQIAWGGAFDTAKRGGTGNRDLMHFDTGPERGNLDPSLRLSRLGPLPSNFDPNAPGGGTQVAARDPRAAVTDAIIAGGQAPPEADQVVRSRDVLGGGGMGGPQPRTASLGRVGIQSDAVPLGLNPTGSNVDAGVAEAVQQRNAIADKILQQEQKIPVREEPSPDPTSTGASVLPTTTSSSLAEGSSTTASPSPRLAQATAPTATDAPGPGSVLGAGLERARAAAGAAGQPSTIPAAPPATAIPAAPPPDSAAYVKPPPFKSAIEPPGPAPERKVLGPSDVQKYWAPFITDRSVSPSMQAKAKRIYDEEEKYRALNQQHLDNDYVSKRERWEKDVDAFKNKDEHDVKTLTGRMALEKAQFDAQHMAPFEAREKAAAAALKEAELARDPITLAKAKADLRKAQLETQEKLFQLRTMNPLEEKSKKLSIERLEQQVAAGEHTMLHGRIVKNVNGEWKDVTPLINPDNIEITESVGKALRYYERGQMAKSQMTKLEQLTNLKEQSQANVRFIGNYLTSDEYKSMRGAANDWLTAIARDDSGATIKDEELDRYYKVYFPVPGDGPRQIQEKADRRSAAERGQYDSLGNAKPIADRYRKEIEAMDATGVPDGAIRTDKKTGEVSEARGGKWRPRK